MFLILCTSPNASEEISGVKFRRLSADEAKDHGVEDGVITPGAVDVETASIFKGIPGYRILDAAPKVKNEKPAEPKVKTTDTEKPAGETGKRGRGRPPKDKAPEGDKPAADSEKTDAADNAEDKDEKGVEDKAADASTDKAEGDASEDKASEANGAEDKKEGEA